MPELNPILSGELIKLSRYDLSLMIQFLSGHNYLLHHEKKMVRPELQHLFTNSKCRLCNLEEETAEHIILKCEALIWKRAECLGKYFIDTEIDTLKPQNVLSLIKEADIINRDIPKGHLTRI